ncbi:hypothetical protein FRC02_006906 [Tulasnella sp. 418]|nr:hypothetical protein FRC02_006906 [Tulasnella sp. 418]
MSQTSGSISDAESTPLSSVVEEDPYPVHDELGTVQASARMLAKSISEFDRPLEPLHLAIALLHDTVENIDDPRLTHYTPTLKNTLFWMVIQRSAKPKLPDTLLEHIKATNEKDETLVMPQIAVSRALKEKILEEGRRATSPPPTPETDQRAAFLQNCSEDMLTILAKAKEIRDRAGDIFIAPHHILLALFEYDPLKEIIEKIDCATLKVGNMMEEVRKLRSQRITDPHIMPDFPLLKKFAIDLTELAEKNKLGPIIGRHHETRRLIAVLSRLYKNNAVLLGDSGVGKTAIAEGLALAIARDEVPESVRARVFSLDLGALLASTACQAVYEELLEDMLREIAEHEERGLKVILFIDELNQITAGGYREGAEGIDAATLMKPFLDKGKLRCVGCSTYEDYRSSIEKDRALARQFSTITICEPAVPSAIDILRGLKDNLQSFHKVKILDEVFVDAVMLATRYFAHKRLPDSAIDLVDEACSSVKIGSDGTKEKLGQFHRKLVAVEMDIRSLEREVDELSDRKLDALYRQRAEIQTKIQETKNSIGTRRKASTLVEDLQRQLKEKKKEMDRYGQVGDRAKRKECVQDYYDLKGKLRDAMAEAKETPDDANSEPDPEESVTIPVVRKNDVVKAAAWYTTIPTAKDSGDPNGGKILTVQEHLSKIVIGQPEAVDAVSSAVRCLMSGLTEASRPVASFIFGGRTGSGKTLLVKELSNFLFQAPRKMVRINGSDYAFPHSISRLIGTPTCTGFDNGGQLTECVRRRPFAVILIEGIEHACPEFVNMIQGILDEGIVKDGAGKVVDFRNCIIVMTTDLGQVSLKAMTPSAEKEHFLREIRKAFPTDFLSRIDDLIIFNPLSSETMPSIIEARVEEVQKQLSKVDIKLEIEESVLWHFEEEGYSPAIGARPLERLLRTRILEPISTLLVENRVPENGALRAYFDEELDDVAIKPDYSRVGHSDLLTPPATDTSGSVYSQGETSTYADSDTDIESSDNDMLRERGPTCRPRVGCGPPMLQPAPQRVW